MMNDFYYSPPVSLYEKRNIKKVFSGTAWLLIGCEVLTVVMAVCFQLIAVFGLGAEERYNDDGQMIVTAAVIFYSSFSVTAALIISSVMCCSMWHIRLGDVFRRGDMTAGKVLALVFISLGAAQLVYIVNIFSSNLLYTIGYEYDPNLANPDNTLGWAAEIISTVIFAPIFEEMFYRGVVMRRLSSVSRHFAVILSALMFGLAHGNPYQFLLGFVLGIIFGYGDIKMKSIIPSIIAHMAVNAHTFINYAFEGMDEQSNMMYTCAVMGVFLIIGTIAALAALKKYGFEPLEYNDYHKKRTLPVLITSAPMWTAAVFAVITLFSSLSRVTQ